MEKTYEVTDISKMLRTNPETVRRWIRDNKLHSVKGTANGKNIITKTMLESFLESAPKKYTTNLMKDIIIPGVSYTMGLIIGSLLVDQFFEARENKHTEFNNVELIKMLKVSIKESEDEINEIEEKMLILQEEIIVHKKRIKKAKDVIGKLSEE